MLQLSQFAWLASALVTSNGDTQNIQSLAGRDHAQWQQLDQQARARTRTPEGATVITVGGDGACDFSQIQTALNSVVLNGPEVEIRLARNTTYTENLLIGHKDLRLVGSYANCTDAAAGNADGQSVSISGAPGTAPVMRVHNPLSQTNRSLYLRQLLLENGKGGLFVEDGNDIEISTEDLVMINNDAVQGGGLFLDDEDSVLLLKDTLILQNTASNGGGMYCAGGDVFMYGFSGVTLNQADGVISNGNGGGLYVTGTCNAVMFSGTAGGLFDFRGIAGNLANRHGGGAYVTAGGHLTLFGHLFVGEFGDNTEPLNLTGNLADADDSGHGSGGGFYVSGNGSRVQANAVMIRDNEAAGEAAFYVGSQADLSIERLSAECWDAHRCNRIQDNVNAGLTAGGDHVITLANAGEVEILNTALFGNRAVDDAVLFTQGTDLLFEGNEVYDNGNPAGSGFAADHLFSIWGNVPVRFNYNTIVDNPVSTSLFRATTFAGVPIMVRNSIVHETGVLPIMQHDSGPSGSLDITCLVAHENSSYSGFQVVLQDPQLVDRGNGDLHLSENSVAVDMCSDAVPQATARDVDYTPRGWDHPLVANQAGEHDAGADEYTRPEVADVSISLSLDTAPPYYNGQDLQYTLNVSNDGPDSALDVALPYIGTHLSVQFNGAGCSGNQCVLSAINAGQSAQVTVQGHVTAPGAFDLSMTAEPLSYDPVTSNNTDASGNGGATQEFFADLSITASLLTPPPHHHGQILEYNLQVHNDGPADSGAYLLSFGPASNLIFDSISGGGCVSMPCSPASIANGQTSSFTARFEIFDGGTVSQKFRVSTQTLWTDPDLSDNEVIMPILLAMNLSDLSISKTLLTAGPYSVGQTLTYRIDYSNAGPDVAGLVQIDDLPENLLITSVSGGGCSAMPCEIAALQIGQSGQITVQAQIVASGAFNNSAAISAQNGFDLNTADNSDDGSDGNNGGITDDDLIFASDFD